MTDNFNYKQFLTENKLGPYSKLKENTEGLLQLLSSYIIEPQSSGDYTDYKDGDEVIYVWNKKDAEESEDENIYNTAYNGIKQLGGKVTDEKTKTTYTLTPDSIKATFIYDEDFLKNL